MKIFKRIAAGLLAIAMAISIAPISAIPVQADDPAVEGNPLRLWYDKPASQGTNILSAGQGYSDADGSNTWQQQTLPIGNGDMGANVYGEIVSEHLTFNEKTLWTGGPSSSRPDYIGGNIESKGNSGYWLKEIQQQFLAGNSSYASQLCGTYLIGTSTGYGSYQPWGDIYFDYKNISTNVTNYQRDLDLTTAVSTVSFTEGGTDYYREFFISHDDNVLVGRLEADGSAKLNLDIRFTSKQGGTTVVSGNNTLVLNGQVSDNQLKYSSYLTVVPEGGSVTGANGKLTITDATAVTVYLSAATDYKNTFYDATGTDAYYYRTGETADQLYARVQADVNAAVAKGYAAVKADHLTDYQELFNRLSLDLGQTVSDKPTNELLTAYKNGSASAAEQRQLEVMLFQYGRYLTIASSREDSQLPSNLQGVWNCLNNPPWASDYHMNVNLQMNYWPTYSTNLAECAMPLIDYVDSLREPGRITAQIYFGVGTGADEATGFTAHTQNTPFGWTCPGWSFDWGWSPAAVPWILQNCWEYYEYTGDVEFMRDYLYPMMKEQAIFYDVTMVRDSNGKLVSAPSYSPEHGPRTAGNTYEQSLAWQLYEDTIIAAETLNMDADLVARWKQNQADLKGPIEVGDSGQLKEWYEETTITSMNSQGADAAGHRHISHMLGLFPGDLVQQNEEWIAAARVSMDYRTDNSTGWGMGQRINTWARLADGNKAHELIQNLFKGGIYPNLWDAHAPFQIDGNFGMTSGVAEMLMQSNMGYINLLPALPDVWAEGSVDGLLARGNFEIAMDWSKGGITEATILSKNGGEAVVLADNITLATVTDGNGNAVAVTTTEDGKISFNTVKGETYTLTIPERPEAPTNLTGVREELAVASLTWDAVAGEGITYNVYRQSDGAEPVQIASGLTATAYTDNALDTEANVVTYMVTAEAGGVESIYSNTAVMAAPATRGMIDNLDSRIIYAGGWANWTENVNYNGSIMYLEGDAYSEDATVTLQFIGTGIEVYTCTNYDRSYFEVFIDGDSYGEVDTYSASTVRQVKIFTEDELEYGLHTLVIKPLNKNNPSCSRNGTYKLELDAFNILAVDVVEVSVAVGQTASVTDDSGYYVGADTSSLDETIATVEVTGNVTSYEKSLSEKVTAVESGKTYVLYNKVAQKLMNNTSADASVGGGGTIGLALSSTLANFQDNDCWTITATNGGYYVQDANGKYLTVARGSAGVRDTAVVISLTYDGTDWTIGQSGEYLNDYGGAHSVVAGWSDINDVNSQWEIYEVITVEDGTTTLTFTGVSKGTTSVQVGDVLYRVTVTAPETSAVASVTVDGVTTEYDTIEEAQEAWVDGSTLTLLKDVSYEYMVNCTGKSVTLDLNGKTYALAGFSLNNANSALTIKDSSQEQAGKVESDGRAVDNRGGTFTLESGTIRSTYDYNEVVYNSEGTVYINGGTIETTGQASDAFNQSNGQTVISGGVLSAKYKAVTLSNGSITVSDDAVIQGERYDFHVYGGTIDLAESDNCLGWTLYLENDLYNDGNVEFLTLSEKHDLEIEEDYNSYYGDVMGYIGTVVCKHTGGTATCEDQAVCDNCGKSYGDPLNHSAGDTDNDHLCDACGDELSQCADDDKDHLCDICGDELSQCADDDKDHLCDICGDELSQCADDDKDHNCDICGDELSQCADDDNDHNCDVCGDELSQCADDDKDHLCDICGDELSQCADDDKDHNCDICGDELSQCADDDKDHLCDICGDELSDCADDDNDHLCDACGDELSQCADDDNDHNCDVCGDELSQCGDTDNDHNCDVCGDELSQCADDDNDHNCDICGDELSQCADADKDHLCDTCGDKLSECADPNKDHNCDVCGDKLSDCGDKNKDGKCDICGTSLLDPAPEKPYKIANVVSGVHVYWKATQGAVKYGLWRSETGKNGTYKWVANPTVPHFTDTKVESGKTYYYKVTTMNANGQHSEKSEAIGIVYVGTPDITSRFNKAAGITLGWNRIEGATGYAIYRKTYHGTDAWVRIATIEGNQTFTWQDTSVKNNNGSAYKYTIRALAGADMKTLSGCRNAGRSMVRLTSRTLSSAVKASATSIKCTWTTSAVVTGYEVRFMVGSTVYKTFTVGNYKTGVKTFTGLEKGKTYKIQVRSYVKIDGMGFYSAWSTARNVTLP